jgi:hypothetical protein
MNLWGTSVLVQNLMFVVSTTGLPNCGTRTTRGTPATVQWCAGLIRKNLRIKIKNPSIYAVILKT